ncbi:MAG: PEGA domain-containing protein [Lachnospiraceae bacterium]|nr:PEGA domain-containing protein [Lachnospiraceae bacterium]
MKKSNSVRKTEYGSGLRKKLAVSTLLGGLTAIALTGCTPEAFNIGQAQGLSGTGTGSTSEAVVYSTYNYLPVGTYDSADTAILKTIDREKKTVTLYNTVAARTYTLNYDGTTYALDKYGTTMSMAQMTEGTIVDVNFYKATKQLVNIQVSPDAWTYESVTRYDLGGINSTATIGDRTYALTKGVQVFSDNGETDLMNIVDGDTITVSGIGYDIYSIKVNSGHGYVRLTHDEALVGGWIEVGGSLITKITEPGMLLTVPEGTYTVHMYNDNSSVTQGINVERNQEVVLDCSGITAPEETYGQILFHVTPESAVLKMDGEIMDISGIIRAEYGVHEIEVSAQGYDTLFRYVNIGNELSEITINLDETRTYVSDNSSIWNSLLNSVSGNTASGNSASANSISRNSVSANSASRNSTSGNTASGNKKVVTANGYNRVYVYYPDNVEVYVDGIYAGLTPMSFKKTVGAHTIILKKPGYETRSYTIYVTDDGEDMSISFSNLEPVNTTTTTTSTATGTGTTSGSTSTGTTSGTSGSSSTGTTSGTSGGTSSGTTADTSGSASGGTSGGTTSGTTGSTSGGTSTDTSGTASGGTSGGTTSGTTGSTSGGTTTDTSGTASGGTSGGTTSGTGGASSGTTTDTSGSATGGTSTGTNSGTSTDTTGSSTGTSGDSTSTGTTSGSTTGGATGGTTTDTSGTSTGTSGGTSSGSTTGGTTGTSETGQHNTANP